MKWFRLFVVSVSMLILYSTTCDDTNHGYHQDIAIVNKSDDAIYLLYANEDSDYIFNGLKYGWGFADTVMPNEISSKFSILSWYNGVSEAQNLLDRETVKYKLLIICQSTLDKYGTEDIGKDEIFDKEFVFTYNSMKAQDFKIVYDGK